MDQNYPIPTIRELAEEIRKLNQAERKAYLMDWDEALAANAKLDEPAEEDTARNKAQAKSHGGFVLATLFAIFIASVVLFFNSA